MECKAYNSGKCQVIYHTCPFVQDDVAQKFCKWYPNDRWHKLQMVNSRVVCPSCLGKFPDATMNVGECADRCDHFEFENNGIVYCSYDIKEKK